ncbi:MAG: hypothetical protein NXI24_06680 [bacterium]|nr:hypothetical protein [bacterium]
MFHNNSDVRIEAYRGEDPAREIYAGRVLRIAGGGRAFVELLRPRLVELFEVSNQNDLEFAHEVHDPARLYQLTTRAQAWLREDEGFLRAARRLLAAFDTGAQDLRFDGPRLRVVPHDGFRVPAAAPAYYVHRDTWFANPVGQWNWWIPVFDTPAGRGFRIYPECFDRSVPNNSGEFDLNEWNRAGGFQSGKAGDSAADAARQVHPRPNPEWAGENLEGAGRGLAIEGRAGDCVLFSAQHLHGTIPNASGRTRFSVELRSVRPGDSGTPRETDNRSRGSTFTTMRPLRDRDSLQAE